MGKRATNIKEQMAILKGRGMILDLDESSIENILLDIGYYRLGFYWHPFERDKSHSFIEGTKFSDIISLYDLEVDLRNTLLNCLKRIEINFRTKIIYIASNKYSTNPIWFANQEVMMKNYIFSLNKKIYSKAFIENNKQIKRHHVKHKSDKYAPAWKTFEYFTFGEILYTFTSIKDIAIKNEISKAYGLNNLKKFTNFMYAIKFLRNTCAHDGVLYDLNLPKGISKIPKVSFFNNDNQSLDAVIKTMFFILNSISPTRRNKLEEDIKWIFQKQSGNKQIDRVIKNKIEFV